MKSKYDIVSEMNENSNFYTLLADDSFCVELWTAFTNITWYKKVDNKLSDIEQVAMVLTEPLEDRQVSLDLNHMADVVAQLRNKFHNKNEDQQDWYCCNVIWNGNPRHPELVPKAMLPYGYVSKRIKEALLKMGWAPVQNNNYTMVNKDYE